MRSSREVEMKRAIFVYATLMPALGYADAYSLAWQSPLASSAPTPVLIPAVIWPLCILALVFLAHRYRAVGFSRQVGTVIALVIPAILLFSVATGLTQADSGRLYNIPEERGNVALSCNGNTLLVQAGVPVKISALSADFDTTSANTLACGTVCEAGAILAADEICTLKCPGAAPVDSDGDTIADANDAFECDENSSFSTRVSGI